jgi:hypothetical protein
MNALSLILDAYNFRARLVPMLVVVLPAALAAVSWFPPEAKWQAAIAGIGGTLALGVLFAEMGRDLGKRKESHLYKLWGGKPSTQLLSYRASSLNPLTLNRYHQLLQRVRPDLRLPSSKEAELTDSPAADTVYESCGDFLRRETRDKTKFPLIFEANASYGFRRNLWAMKPAAIGIGILSAAACVLRVYMDAGRTGTITAVPTVALLLIVLLLVWWTARISPSWVKPIAFAYGEQLLEACQDLEERSTGSSGPKLII